MKVRSHNITIALKMLFWVSEGTLQAVQIYGGLDLIFLGVIAYWLFTLRIWVELLNGETIFSNYFSPEIAHVHLLYADVTQISDSLLSVSTTTLLLRSIRDLITDNLHSLITFRIDWKSCLAELFYNDVENILNQLVLLGEALGAIARIFKASYSNEDDAAGLSRTHFIHFQERGHGAGFLDNVATIFPEVGAQPSFRRAAIRSLFLDVPDSI